MAYATDPEAVAYYAGTGATDTELGVTKRRAASLVQRYAPAPAPEPADYARLAADAELEVGRYLWETDGGSVTSDSLSGAGSTSYAAGGYIRRAIRETMGSYYTGGTPVPIRPPRRYPVPLFINDPLDLKGPYYR